MARVKVEDLPVERAATEAESTHVVGGAGFSIQIGGYGYRAPYGGYRGYCPTGGNRRVDPYHSYHDTSHYHYAPPAIIRHGRHLHVRPGGYYLHRTGHIDHHH